MSINLYTKEKMNIDIIADVRFTKANEVFKSVAAQSKIIGKATTKSNKPIHPKDLEIISEYFDNETNVVLDDVGTYLNLSF